MITVPKYFLLYVILVIILGLAVGLRLIWSWQDQSRQIIPKEKYIKLVVTVDEEPRTGDYYQRIKVGDGQVFANLHPRFAVGDRLQIEGEVDSRGRIYYPKIVKIGQRVSANSYLSNLRTKTSQNILSFLPAREATLVAGTVLGIDTIESSFRDDLIRTGTIHVVVVSGQNLTIVAGIFIAFASYLGRRVSLVLATLAVFAYAVITGFEPPVVRASLMVLAATLAVYFGRESFPLWNLMVAALIIVFIWPQAMFEVSFQLTFAATLGIMTLGRLIGNSRGPVASFPPARAPQPFLTQSNSLLISKSKKGGVRAVGNPATGTTPRKVWHQLFRDLVLQNAAIATSAYIFSAPIILFYFGRVSIVAPLANILIAEAVFPLMVFGFLAAFLGLIFAPLGQLIAYFAYIPAFYFTRVVETLAKIPLSQLLLSRGNLILVMAVYFVVLALIFIWSKKAKSF